MEIQKNQQKLEKLGSCQATHLQHTVEQFFEQDWTSNTDLFRCFPCNFRQSLLDLPKGINILVPLEVVHIDSLSTSVAATDKPPPAESPAKMILED